MFRRLLPAIRRITTRVIGRSGVLATATASVLAVGLMAGTASAQTPPEFAAGRLEVGGILSSTVLTLLVLPVLYRMFAGDRAEGAAA